MLSTSCLPENELILECYHPSAKISTPYLSCQYLGLKAGDGATAVPDDGHNNDHIGLTELGRLYSAFRPRKTEENRRRRGIWFSRLAAMTVQPRDDREDDVATQDVYLDEGELFSQLCTATNVVKEGSKKGFFINHVNISEGVVRVWRGWLLSQATGLDFGSSERSGDGDQILWVDTAKTVGLKFQVEAGPADTMPLISDLQDEPAVQYRLTYEGKYITLSLPVAPPFNDSVVNERRGGAKG